MALQTRQITGPIETPEHEVVAQGFLRIQLLYPIADEDTLVAPFKLEYNITNGTLPVSCKLAVPGSYQFQILDIEEERVWTFQVEVFPNSGTPISVAELWLLSRLLDGIGDDENPENFDASLLGSNGATDGQVLTADGVGGAAWEFVSGSGLGDMLKIVYDTNDDGRVDAADQATAADLADDSTRFGGLLPADFQEALQDATTEGTLLTWDTTLEAYTPNGNAQLTDGGTLYVTGLHVTGATFGNVFVMNQVYYSIGGETHVLVIMEDDVEVRLPDPIESNGRVIEIKKGSADGKLVMISSAGTGKIDGEANYYLNYKYEAITCVAMNNGWFIF